MDVAIWIVLIILSLPSLFLLARVPYSAYASARMLRVADAFWKEAVKRGKQDDVEVRDIHDSIVGVSVMAPLAVSGFAVPSSESREEDRALASYLNQNGWIFGYTAAAFCTVNVLLFLGHPFARRSWHPALFSWVALRFFSGPEGTVQSGTLDPEVNAERFDKAKNLKFPQHAALT